MKAILSLILLVSLSFSAESKKGGTFSSIGGEGTCGKFVSNYGIDELTNNIYKIYIVGFVTGSNHATSRKISSRLDGDGLVLWVLNYCKANPMTPFLHAIMELDIELDRKYTVK